LNASNGRHRVRDNTCSAAFRRPLLLYPAGSKNTRLADGIVKLAARFRPRRGGEKTRDGFPFFRKPETFLKIHARAVYALRVRIHAAASDRNGIPLASVALAETYKSHEYTHAVTLSRVLINRRLVPRTSQRTRRDEERKKRTKKIDPRTTAAVGVVLQCVYAYGI